MILLTDEQITNERARRTSRTTAYALIDGARRGHLIRDVATRRAIKHLMIASHSRRCGELPREPLLGDDAPMPRKAERS